MKTLVFFFFLNSFKKIKNQGVPFIQFIQLNGTFGFTLDQLTTSRIENYNHVFIDEGTL